MSLKNKAVLISIRPGWCGQIAAGKKTVEIRRNVPSLDFPFRCYIYCTQATPLLAWQERWSPDKKAFRRMGMKVGHIHTLRDVENYIDTQPEATPQEVAGQCWRNSKYDPPTEADADRLGRIIVWGAAVKHVDITYWENAIFHPVDVPFWMPLPVAPEEKSE